MALGNDIQGIFAALGLAELCDSAAGMEVRTPIDGSRLACVAIADGAQAGAVITRRPRAAPGSV